ncbi:hypothetical protein FACS189447_01650 [Spirochaetia bacterium]|nr:hypothetical protein FACS189447_01650 [Spirochaetia bacterium]
MEEEKGIIGRFIELRKKFGPSQEKFGKMLGLSDGSISLIESGKTTINEKHIKLVSGVLSINEKWLRSGEGPLFKDGKVPDGDTMLEMFRTLSLDGRKMVLDYINLMLKNEKAMWSEKEWMEKGELVGIYPDTKPLSQETHDPEPAYIPATPDMEGFDNVVSIDYDMVGIPDLDADTAAGELKTITDINPNDYQTIPVSRKLLKADPANCFCITIRGTSMVNADISDGDRGIFAGAEDPENGAIMLVRFEDKSTLKRIAIKHDKIFLCWEDGSGQEREVQKDGYRILGKLLLVLKKSS